MENKIQIQYKDSESWLSLTGIKTLWLNYNIRTTEGRVYSKWLQPVSILESWNGNQFVARRVYYNSYFVEFYIKESEIEVISKLQNCTDIIIKDLTAGKDFIPDLSDLTLFEVSEPAQVADTTNYIVSILFRTNKTYLNYGSRAGLDYSLLIYNSDANNEFKAIDTEYMTALNGAKGLVYPLKYEPIYTANDAEIQNANNANGINIATKIIAKNTVSLLHFGTESESNTIKKYGTLCNNVALCFNTVFRAGTGTITKSTPTAASGTVTWNDENTFSFSANQNQLQVGYLLKIGLDYYTIAALAESLGNTVGCTVIETVSDFGTVAYSWLIPNAIVFSEPITNLIVGMKLKKASETVQISEITTDYVLTTPALANSYTGASFELSVIEKFTERAIITGSLLSENFYKTNINGIINVLPYYPES